MPTDLPYAAEAESSLGYDELEVSSAFQVRTASQPGQIATVAHGVALYWNGTTGREDQLIIAVQVLRTQYYKEIEQGHVTTQSKFNYGEPWLGYRSECTQ